jgi:uncharacterized FAD-dependent dehydrogenase
MRQSLIRAGAEFMFNTTVTDFQLEKAEETERSKSSITGVKLHDGRTINTTSVVLAVGIIYCLSYVYMKNELMNVIEFAKGHSARSLYEKLLTWSVVITEY